MIELGTLHGANPAKSFLKASFGAHKQFNEFDFSEPLCFLSGLLSGLVKFWCCFIRKKEKISTRWQQRLGEILVVCKYLIGLVKKFETAFSQQCPVTRQKATGIN